MNQTKQFTEEFEKEFFSRLADRLEELFPKTNQDHPEIPSEGNRLTALVLNAFANLIFRDILKKVVTDLDSLWRERVRERIEEREKILKKYLFQTTNRQFMINNYPAYRKEIKSLRDQILKNLLVLPN